MGKKKAYTKDDIEYINTEDGNPNIRKKALDIYYKKGISLILLEPGCFDHGIKRLGMKRDGYAAVYDYDSTVCALADAYMKWNSDNSTYNREQAETDAMEWIDYNTIRSIPYMRNGEGVVPKIVVMTEGGREKMIS